MTGEHAIRFKEPAAADISSERGEYVAGIESSGSVSCINYYLESCQRSLAVSPACHLFDYHLSHMC